MTREPFYLSHKAVNVQANTETSTHTNIRDLACVTVGRANVDFYPPIGETLDKTRHYDAFVGGSPANIAAGMSKLGLPVGILTRVAEDVHGHFVVQYLASHFGIDVSQVQFDSSGARTSLAFAERRSDATTLMYRNNVADLQLDADAIAEAYIAKSASVFVSGTALTEEPSRSAVFRVLDHARAHNTICAIDIDYRPYGWTGLEEAATCISKALARCDVIIGTREEFEVAGIASNVSDEACAKSYLENTAKFVVVKHGEHGSNSMYMDKNGDIATIKGKVFPVTLTKPYGAGDAFASALLGSLLLDYELETALAHAAASASINISGTSCTEAMPTLQEINAFIQLQTI